MEELNKGLIESNKEWLRVYGELENENARIMHFNYDPLKSIPISVIQNTLDKIDSELEEKYSAEKISVFSGNTYMEKFKLLGGRQVLNEILEKGNK